MVSEIAIVFDPFREIVKRTWATTLVLGLHTWVPSKALGLDYDFTVT